MNNKELKEQRIKGYFIQAAKEILVGEGIKSLSVRTVSERAGYSYTTIYNYFEDLNDLIFYCVQDFYQECFEFVNGNNSENLNNLSKIEAKVMEYIKYFVNYPSVFELFFIERVINFGNKVQTIDLITNSLKNIMQKEWDKSIAHHQVSSSEAVKMQNRLQLSVTGLLLFYINRRTPAEYSEFMRNSKQEIHSILFKES
jgi:AcrR family transcriptional regulator